MNEMVASSRNMIDTEKLSKTLRSRGIDKLNRRILISKIEGSIQEKDLAIPPNCSGFGRIHHFYRYSEGEHWPQDPLPIDPATNALGLPKVDMIQVQLFQNAICSWRCWYCFVDYDRLSGNLKHSEFKSADELLDLYEREDMHAPIIDLSGGQPDLVPEWGLWLIDAIEKRGLSKNVYVWSDDNLSNEYLWRYLSKEDIVRLASRRNYGRVGCFKGYNAKSFSFNTGASAEKFDAQFNIMKRLVDSRFDVYGYVTLTSDSDSNLFVEMENFIERLQSEIHPLFPLRTVPLQIFKFTPTSSRMTDVHLRALDIQTQAVQAWTEEIKRRYSPSDLGRSIHLHILEI